METYLKEVETRMLSLASKPKPSKWKPEDYIGGGESKLRYLNLKIPIVRAVYRKGFSFANDEPEKQWRIWDYIWNHSDIFEVMLMASYWAASRPFEETFQHRKQVLKWLDRVDNWGHSDELSAHYARFLEHDPRALLPVFEKWSSSKKPWLKRQALVGLMFYSRFRKRHPEVNLILKFIDRHIDDDHYYVRKGLGWALRECWNVYPEKTFAYLKTNARRIPPEAWTAATEKLAPEQKKMLMQLRRKRSA